MSSCWIQTFTGLSFDFMELDKDSVNIYDITHALSNICRFTGHCKTFYSVADHSLRVSEILPDEYKLIGLLHDSPEAYINDLSRPLKHISSLGPYNDLEKRIMKTILSKFDLLDLLEDGDIPQKVKDADMILLATEQRDLMNQSEYNWSDIYDIKPLEKNIYPLSPNSVAETQFLMRFQQLLKQRELVKKDD